MSCNRINKAKLQLHSGAVRHVDPAEETRKTLVIIEASCSLNDIARKIGNDHIYWIAAAELANICVLKDGLASSWPKSA